MTPFLAGLQYLPPVSYFAAASLAGVIVLEQQENYQKRTWRNRTAILGSSEPLHLTVPLAAGKNEQEPIRKVRIATGDPWARRHLQSIRTAYGRAPFFSAVFPELEAILQQRHMHLWSLNEILLNWSFDLLKLSVEIRLSDTFTCPGTEPHDGRSGLAPGTGSAPMEFFPSYPQILRPGLPFQPNLSVLDVLCHLGPMSGSYIRDCAASLPA